MIFVCSDEVAAKLSLSSSASSDDNEDSNPYSSYQQLYKELSQHESNPALTDTTTAAEGNSTLAATDDEEETSGLWNSPLHSLFYAIIKGPSLHMSG